VSYDPKCFDLATEFLDDYRIVTNEKTAIALREISQAIQDAIEECLDSLIDRDIIEEKP
jgi:hypothetical protein